MIRRFPNCRKFISRARLTTPEKGTTPLGEALSKEIAAVDGTDPGTAHGYGINVMLAHAALWSWDEVEPQVIAAFARVLGTDVEVIREDVGPQARTEATI